VDVIVVIYCDIINNILFVNDPICALSFCHKKILMGEIDLIHISIKNQVVDIFSKALGACKLHKFKSVLNVLDVDLSLKGSVENPSSTN